MVTNTMIIRNIILMEGMVVTETLATITMIIIMNQNQRGNNELKKKMEIIIYQKKKNK